MIFIRNDFDTDDATQHTIIVPGRLHHVTIRRPGAQRGLAVFNANNFSIASPDITKMRRAIARLRLLQYDIFVVGDFNIGVDATPTSHTSHDGATRRFRDTREHARWQGALASLAEISHNLPTRAATRQTMRGAVTSHRAIDRVFTSLSPATLAHTRATARADPIHHSLPTPHHVPASDHVPVTVAFTSRPTIAPQFCPSPHGCRATQPSAGSRPLAPDTPRGATPT